MNKLIVLVLALAIAAPVLADDLIPPVTSQDGEWGLAGTPWRGLPGSTYSQWTYDDPCGVGDWDMPEVTEWYSHPLKEDPWIEDPCSGAIGGQFWVTEIDPCTPAWYDNMGARQGGIEMKYASWDINNFVHDQPAKDIWIQITYMVPGQVGVSMDPCAFGAGYNGMVPGDPCGVPMGEFEGNVADWDPLLPEIIYTWPGYPDPCDPCTPVFIGWTEAPLSEWDPCAPEPQETWDNSLPHEGDIWVDGVMESRQVLEDNWIHEVWSVAFPENPGWEWIEFGYVADADGDVKRGIIIDQIVIDTLCYVPEPATMVLLGLGSLMMIRRKKR